MLQHAPTLACCFEANSEGGGENRRRVSDWTAQHDAQWEGRPLQGRGISMPLSLEQKSSDPCADPCKRLYEEGVSYRTDSA